MKSFKKQTCKLLSILLTTSMLAMSGCGLFDDDYDEDYDERYEDYLSSDNSTSGGHSTAGGAGVNTTLYDSSAVRQHQVQLKGNNQDKVTIMLYMNGSNLETDDGEATTDLSEIINAGSSDNVNVVVQTMGTKKWQNYSINANHSQRYEVSGSGLTLVDDSLGQLDCTVASTLGDFISWSAANYPADRYILIFWNHGGGPVYGFGYDEWNSDSNAALTIDEMQTALKNGGVYFDFIGMDCCIMSSLEVCVALYDYCDYTILSEDFESGLGWYYTDWMSKLYNNSSIPTTELGQYIVDDMVSANERDTYAGDNSILALIDESMMRVLWTAWTDFAYANEAALLDNNYSRVVIRANNGRIHPAIQEKFPVDSALVSRSGIKDYFYSDYYSDEESYSLSQYYITDIMSLASTLDTAESNALRSAVNNTLLYVRASAGDAGLTGISITLPYGDSTFYADLRTIFNNCGFDSKYVDWLNKFVSAEGTSSYYDYSDWDDDWDGWDYYDDDYDWDTWDWFDDDSYDYWDDWNDDSWGSSFWDYWDYDDFDYDYYDSYYYDDDYYYYDDDYYYYDDDDWWY
ncbi:MAG: clostripain-related cysteine peptidase [Lachnospiraceae bacterium]|nr:clostripain-related cysteine peptidase [Lachnospiraceae bacterium]